MQKSLIALSGALVLMSATPALAQSASQPIVAGAPAPNVLRAGTAVPLKMAEALTTKGKKLRVGYRFMLEIAEPVTVNGQIVIPAGSPVTGEVTDVRNKGMWGKSGHINARVLFVRANGRQIRMTGQLDDKGVTGTAGVVAAIAFVPIAGFFTTGTSAQIPLGAPVNAFIDEDVPVTFADGTPAAMTVPAVAATQANAPATPTVAPAVVTPAVVAQPTPAAVSTTPSAAVPATTPAVATSTPVVAKP
ncbi:hypothetical protein [Sphingomonas alpina]|uniref:hypothetical protein n=1 Tax=Sphingomonas alpina TaxID=653931 RepID=UPI0028F14D72|nr:hypothetical protein [Sphingomonas alpina]